MSGHTFPEHPEAVLNQLPIRLQNMVRKELGADEELIWVEQPNPKTFLYRSILVVLYGIAFSVFGYGSLLIFFNESTAPGDDVGSTIFIYVFFTIPVIVMLLIGTGALLSPLFMWHQAVTTVYMITDKRLMIVTCNWWLVSSKSFPPEKIEDITRRGNADGSGDFLFFNRFSLFKKKSYFQPNMMHDGFIGIRDVKQVDDLVHKTLLTTPVQQN